MIKLSTTIQPQIVERCLVKDSHESFSTFTLSDGTVLRGKVTIVEANRTDQFDNLGFPQYQIMNIQTIWQVASCPEDLKARKQ